MAGKRPKIGLFDSGLGGLTVARAIRDLMPWVDLVYLGDTLRCPYGTRSLSEVREFTLQGLSFLEEQHVDVLVVACNTATASLRISDFTRFALPVIGAIEPAVAMVEQTMHLGSVGLVATLGTLESGVYRRLLPARYTLHENALSELVPIVEAGVPDRDMARHLIQEHISPLLSENIGTLVLGCTHFPVVRSLFEETAHDLFLIDPALEIARRVLSLILSRSQSTGPIGRPKHRFYTTGDAYYFASLAHHIFGEPITAKRILLLQQTVISRQIRQE